MSELQITFHLSIRSQFLTEKEVEQQVALVPTDVYTVYYYTNGLIEFCFLLSSLHEPIGFRTQKIVGETLSSSLLTLQQHAFNSIKDTETRLRNGLKQKFRLKKTRQNEPFLAFFLNFWPLAMLNATFSGIFKHGAQVESDF